MLRAVAESDIKNFSGEGSKTNQQGKPTFKFEGNIEDQALILQKTFCKQAIELTEEAAQQ